MRKQKIITVQFADGEQQLPSSIKITCTVTDNKKSFYTPYLVKLIKRKYDNNYNQFITSYVSKEGRGQQRAQKQCGQGIPEEDDLSQYKRYLALQHAAVRGKRDMKSRNMLHHILEVWERRFSGCDITKECIAF